MDEPLMAAERLGRPLDFMALAVAAAENFVGATAPNPPVGACIAREGKILAVGAHERAGLAHAEVAAIEQARLKHGAHALRGASLYVTLEPCNHFGKTPPCTKAILDSGITHVYYGVSDPNPHVEGRGAEKLRQAGIPVNTSPELEALCAPLIAPFRKRMAQGLPWIVHKIALRRMGDGSLTMLPPPGRKTFSSAESLELAHRERKQADAILTDRATVEADLPEFTVRHLPDHPDRRRLLVVLSRNGKPLPQHWIEREEKLGFTVFQEREPLAALKKIAEMGALKVLVEAGPTLSRALENQGLWDERLVFYSDPDRIVREFK